MSEFEKKGESTEPAEVSWDQAIHRTEQITDGLNKPIEPGMVPTITGLNLLSIHTRNSCEGHERGGGVFAPYVQLEAENRPRTAHMGEQVLIDRLAQPFRTYDELREAYQHARTTDQVVEEQRLYERIEAIEQERDTWIQETEPPETFAFKQWAIRHIALKERAQQLVHLYNESAASTNARLESRGEWIVPEGISLPRRPMTLAGKAPSETLADFQARFAQFADFIKTNLPLLKTQLPTDRVGL